MFLYHNFHCFFEANGPNHVHFLLEELLPSAKRFSWPIKWLLKELGQVCGSFVYIMPCCSATAFAQTTRKGEAILVHIAHKTSLPKPLLCSGLNSSHFCTRLRDSPVRIFEKAWTWTKSERKLFPFCRLCPLFACLLLSRLRHYLRAWNRLSLRKE